VAVQRRTTGTTAVVLGGTGFIGRAVAAAFVEAGMDVLAVANRPNTRQSGARWRFLDLAQAPIRDLATLVDQEKPAVVVNCAGTVWGATEEQIFAGTVVLTHRVLAALGQAEHRTRLIHIGSVQEYGATAVDGWVLEHSPTRPTGLYGRLKLASTNAVLSAVANADVDGTVLRVTNIAGPGTPSASLLGRVADALLAGQAEGHRVKIPLAPLRARRDYIDVRDVADAVLAAATVPAAVPLVNIGRGEAVAVRDLVHGLIEASGLPAVVEEIAGPGAPASTAAETDLLRVETTAAREHLGWAARRSIPDSLRDHWQAVASVGV